jgi:putative addiction module killer protein
METGALSFTINYLVTYEEPYTLIQIREYVDERGKSPFARWFAALDPFVAARITVAVSRLSGGGTSRVKSVGGGVFEFRVDSGPGYHVYFGRHGGAIVILLGGGTKRRQARDIERARQRWQDYKNRERARDAADT